MGSNRTSYEFDTSSSTVKAKIEYITVNHQPASLKADLLMFLYLKQTDETAPLVYDKQATVKASGNSKTWAFINGSFLSVPYTGDWCKVGVAIIQGFVYSEKKNWLGWVTGNACTPNITISGSVGNISIYDSRTISLEELTDRTDVTRSTFKQSIDQTTSINNTVSFEIVRNYENTYHRVRYFWGKTNDDFNCLFTDSGCSKNVHSSSTDYFTLSGDSLKLYLNLLKNGNTGLTRANELVNKEKDCCAIILESYAGTDYLGNTLLHLYFTVGDSYKPSVTEKTIQTVNANSIAEGWGIALQGYSSATASCAAVQTVEADKAQIAEYEIAVENGDSVAADVLNTNVFQTSGRKKFTFTARDSRGRTAEETDYLTVLPYYLPQVSFENLYRCDTEGNKADKGKNFFVKPLVYFASCDGHNSVSMSCIWKKTTDKEFEEANVAQVQQSGTVVEASLSETSSYDVVLVITDALSGTTESMMPLTSGKVLLHFNKGGRSLGIGMYNYDANTCKVGYDFFIGEAGLDDYIQSIVGDFITERGTIENGTGTWAYHNGTETQAIDFSGIVWRYEKYQSGKVELWGNCAISNIKPYKTNNTWTYINPNIPKINQKYLIEKNNYDLVYVGGVSDSLAIISKGTTDGYSGSQKFSTLFYRNSTWTEGTITPVIDFHITAIPK